MLKLRGVEKETFETLVLKNTLTDEKDFIFPINLRKKYKLKIGDILTFEGITPGELVKITFTRF